MLAWNSIAGTARAPATVPKLGTPSARARRWLWRGPALLRGALLSCALSGAALGVEPTQNPPAAAQPSPTPELRQALTDDHCRNVIEGAASQSALLWSPEVFSRFGTLHGSSGSSDDAQNVVGDQTRLSLQAGVGLRPLRMREGALVEARARAECERYGAELALEALQAQLASDPSAALSAKAAALRSKLPEAEALLDRGKKDLSQSRINLPRYSALRARVAALQRALEDTEIELASATAGARAAAPEGGAPALDALVHAERALQSAEGGLRQLGAFDVNVRGGYERIFGQEQSLPLFGSVTVSFWPGRFWQSGSESRGASARQRWVENRVRQVRERLGAAATSLAQQLATSRRQQARLEGELGELQAHYAELERVNSPAAREFQSDLWFDLAQLEADLAFARARSEALAQQRTQILRVLGP